MDKSKNPKNSKNTTNLDNQGNEKNRKLMNEDEYYSKVNEIPDKVSLNKKIKIFLSSFKNITITFLIITYVIPFLILFSVLFINAAGSALMDIINQSIIFENIITKQQLYLYTTTLLGNYLYYIDFGWIIEIISFGHITIQTIFMFITNILNNYHFEPQQTSYLSFLLTTIIILIFNFIIWLSISKIFIEKPLWDGKSDIIEYLTKKLQKTIGESTTLIDEKIKKNKILKVKKIKSQIINELKKSTDKQGIIKDKVKLLTVLPAYKIAFLNKDSVFGNMIAEFSNKQWKIHVKNQTTIENFKELYDFLFTSKFTEEQKEIITKLYWSKLQKTIFKENIKEAEIIEIISKNQKIAKIAIMQTLIIIKNFKNFPLYSAIRFLENKKIIFSKSQKLILTNAKKIIDNQINNPDIIIDLSLDLTLPNIKNKEIKEKLINNYSEFINNNNKEMRQLESEAQTEVLWDPETRFKITLKEYKQKYLKILKNFIKIVFDNYNYKRSENFENNIEEVFNEYFNKDETEVALIQIAQFKVIKLEDFYNMLDMVMKKETIYGKKIIPLYVEYFKNLKIKETLYRETKK